ncbi:hypothetical protein ACWEWI_07300 [Streptomyces sp. NPDC003753]
MAKFETEQGVSLLWEEWTGSGGSAGRDEPEGGVPGGRHRVDATGAVAAALGAVGGADAVVDVGVGVGDWEAIARVKELSDGIGADSVLE